MGSDETSIHREEDRSDTIIFFRPPHHYKDRVNEIVTERISIPQTAPGATRQFSFIITDRYGDGMCCTWNGELETGYTLYEGDPSSDNVIVNSKFESVGREIKTFHVNGDKVDGINSSEMKIKEASIQIKATIMLDAYPDETGFFVTDSSGKRVVYVPPGTFTEKNGVVEKLFALPAGLYAFTIIDTFGDGMNRDDSAYMLDILGDSSRPAILTGTGDFRGGESQTFLLEGDEARYPLHINMKAGRKPNDFCFSIYRIDLIDSVATIASRSKGAYKLAYEDISESLLVTRGALYRIVFENAYFGVTGKIRINLGSSDPNLYKAIEYTVDTADTQNSQRWQVKMYADEPIFSTGNDATMLTLQIQPDRFPGQIEWIILSNHNNTTARRPSFYNAQEKNEIIAYGPSALHNEVPDSGVRHEIIMIPRSNGNQSYSLIVTGAENNGTCCGLEDDALLRLYDGQVRDGSLISLEKFEREGRLVLFFSLIDSRSAGFQSSMQYGCVLSSVIFLFVLMVV